MNTFTKTISRIVFGLPFAVFGIFHLMRGSDMAGMVWLPGGTFWIYLTGIALIAAGISFTVNRYVHLAAWGLAAFLFITTFTIHLPMVFSQGQQAMTGFLKDLMLLGAALYFAGAFTPEKSESDLDESGTA